MDSPFYNYRSHWNYPPRPSYFYSPSPVQKVVSIPVRYVGVEQSRSESDSAVKIQKVLRGFLVRKSVRKIEEVRREVDEVEKRILTEEELIGRDSKERLKVNETLMNLLFKLDSVRGVDSGVRDLRKAVIKKAIALQEKVDATASIEAKNLTNVGEISQLDGDCKLKEAEDVMVPEIPDSEKAANTSLSVSDAEYVATNQSESQEDSSASVSNSQNLIEGDGDDDANHSQSLMEGDEEDGANHSQSLIEGDGDDDADHSQGLIDGDGDDGANHSQSLIEGDGGDGDANHSRSLIEGDGGDGDHDQEEGTADGESRRSQELLERLMQDNDKMMDMMAKLFERNEMQTRLLSSLSKRVEQLERAFICERLRRKKKRSAHAANELADCLESTQDCKKYGKKL